MDSENASPTVKLCYFGKLCMYIYIEIYIYISTYTDMIVVIVEQY